MRQPKGIRSIETGFRVLRALELAKHPLTLTQIAKASHIGMSSARFYLVSLIRAGAVTQTSAGGLYRLGPAALRMGLAALSQNDALQLARDRLEALRDETGETVFLSVWGEFGPVVVNRVDGDNMAPLGIRVGSHPTMLRSATGRAFLAHMPESITRPLVRNAPGTRRSLPVLVGARLDDIVAEASRKGFFLSERGVLPGIQAVAAPVFGIEGLQCVITIMGHECEFDVSEKGRVVTALLAAARSCSKDAGYDGISRESRLTEPKRSHRAA